MKKSKLAKKTKHRKVVARKSAPRKHVARKTAPVAAPSQEAPQPAAPKEQSYPCNVLVKKGHEQVPVTVTNAAHHKRLADEFGAEHVEVQS